jgi:hypothetical protein
MILDAGRLAGRSPAAIADALLIVLGTNKVWDCLSVLGRIGLYAIAADTAVAE